jgi:condensin complex subunit 2
MWLRGLQKITQRNTWDLKLIDHLSTLVKGGHDDEDQTNFQKVSSMSSTTIDLKLGLRKEMS